MSGPIYRGNSTPTGTRGAPRRATSYRRPAGSFSPSEPSGPDGTWPLRRPARANSDPPPAALRAACRSETGAPSRPAVFTASGGARPIPIVPVCGEKAVPTGRTKAAMAPPAWSAGLRPARAALRAAQRRTADLRDRSLLRSPADQMGRGLSGVPQGQTATRRLRPFGPRAGRRPALQAVPPSSLPVGCAAHPDRACLAACGRDAGVKSGAPGYGRWIALAIPSASSSSPAR